MQRNCDIVFAEWILFLNDISKNDIRQSSLLNALSAHNAHPDQKTLLGNQSTVYLFHHR